MKQKLLLVLATVFAVIGLSSGTAFAWTYGLTGSGDCQPDGSYLITWKIDNSTENETLTIRDSSNVIVVPVGTTVPAHQMANFTQTADGTVAGTFTLSLKANWPSDTTQQSRTATVTLAQPCTQPTPPTTPPTTPPPTGGRGGGETVAETTVTPQVVTPVGPVHAGNGGGNTKAANIGALLSLSGVALLLAIGSRRLHEDQ